MAEALHCATTPAGLALSLEDVHERLKALADEERALPLPAETAPSAATTDLPLPDAEASAEEALRQWRFACENARFAVYAWADEQILQSARLDAADWLGYSLQYRYFHTTGAGREFFSRLAAIVHAAVPDAETPLPGEEDAPDAAPRMLEVAALHGLDERSAAVVETYALCLLYGFRGMLHDYEEALTRCRKAAYALLRRADAPVTAAPLPRRLPAVPGLATALENAAYVLLPLLVVLVFGTLCAAELADIPLPQF